MATEPLIERLTHKAWTELLRSAERSVLHLEMRDLYAVDDEEFARWKAGRPPFDPTDRASWWFDWWHGTIADATKRGVQVRRARIVSEPVTDYVRFEYDVTYTNVAAGERVRWLSRRHSSDLSLPGNDFWLFDNQLVIFNHFTGNGDSLGEERCTDTTTIKLCAAAFDATWSRATPHEEYRPT